MPSEDERISEVLEKLQLRKRTYYLSQELATAFKVTRTTIQRSAKKHSIGKIVKCERGSRGVRIFFPWNVVELAQHIQFPGKEGI